MCLIKLLANRKESVSCHMHTASESNQIRKKPRLIHGYQTHSSFQAKSNSWHCIALADWAKYLVHGGCYMIKKERRTIAFWFGLAWLARRDYFSFPAYLGRERPTTTFSLDKEKAWEKRDLVLVRTYLIKTIKKKKASFLVWNNTACRKHQEDPFLLKDWLATWAN